MEPVRGLQVEVAFWDTGRSKAYAGALIMSAQLIASMVNHPAVAVGAIIVVCLAASLGVMVLGDWWEERKQDEESRSGDSGEPPAAE